MVKTVLPTWIDTEIGKAPVGVVEVAGAVALECPLVAVGVHDQHGCAEESVVIRGERERIDRAATLNVSPRPRGRAVAGAAGLAGVHLRIAVEAERSAQRRGSEGSNTNEQRASSRTQCGDAAATARREVADGKMHRSQVVCRRALAATVMIPSGTSLAKPSDAAIIASRGR